MWVMEPFGENHDLQFPEDVGKGEMFSNGNFLNGMGSSDLHVITSAPSYSQCYYYLKN